MNKENLIWKITTAVSLTIALVSLALHFWPLPEDTPSRGHIDVAFETQPDGARNVLFCVDMETRDLQERVVRIYRQRCFINAIPFSDAQAEILLKGEFLRVSEEEHETVRRSFYDQLRLHKIKFTLEMYTTLQAEDELL